MGVQNAKGENSMKKQITAMLLALCALGATACGAETKNTVTLSGSTSVQPLMNALAAAFEEANEGIDVQVAGGGSGKGIKDAQDGTVDFGMASRAIKSTETGVEYRTIALDGIALVVNKNCSVTEVTTEEVFALYAKKTPVQGTIVNPIARGATSGTRGAFDELIFSEESGEKVYLKDVGLADGVAELDSGGLVLTEIAKSTGVNAMGYVSLGSVGDGVKALKFNGVEASLENVKNGQYKLSRPFVIAWKTGKELSEAAKAFYEFLCSEAAQSIVADEGYITVD